MNVHRIGNGGIVPPWLQPGAGGVPSSARGIAPFDGGQFLIESADHWLGVTVRATGGNERATVLIGKRDNQYTGLGKGAQHV